MAALSRKKSAPPWALKYLVAVEIQAVDPDRLAERWALALGLDVASDRSRGGETLTLAGMRFHLV